MTVVSKRVVQTCCANCLEGEKDTAGGFKEQVLCASAQQKGQDDGRLPLVTNWHNAWF